MVRSRSSSAFRLRSRSRNRNSKLSSPNAAAASAMTRGLHIHAHLNLTGWILQESRDPIGSGGFCDVYRGLSLAHGKCVAIKKFRGHTIGDQVKVSKFRRYLARELEVWAKLHHPNILPLLGYTTDATAFPALISELMSDGTVLQYCLKVPEASIFNLVKGFAGGLYYLHSKGIVHSDVKSDNILVDSSGRPRLADFGLSKLFIQTGTMDSSSCMKGSIRWMPKEVLKSEEYDTNQTKERLSLLSLQADVWSFGMTVYELLSKGRPYAQLLNDVQVIFAIVRGELPSTPRGIETGDGKIHARILWELCKRCWADYPDERPTMLHITFELNCQRDLPLDRTSVGSQSGSRRKSTGSLGSERPFIAQQVASGQTLFVKRPPETYKSVKIADKNTSLLSQYMRQAGGSLPAATPSLSEECFEEESLATASPAVSIGQDMRPRSLSMNDLPTSEDSASGGAPDQLRQLLRSLFWKENYHSAGW